MYEMYPDTWTETVSDRRPSANGGRDAQAVEQPRRRARREHSVAPRVVRVSR